MKLLNFIARINYSFIAIIWFVVMTISDTIRSIGEYQEGYVREWDAPFIILGVTAVIFGLGYHGRIEQEKIKQFNEDLEKLKEK